MPTLSPPLPSPRRRMRLQQPTWDSEDEALAAIEILRQMPGLARESDIEALLSELPTPAHPDRQVIQFGDCAEDPFTEPADAALRAQKLGDDLASQVPKGLSPLLVGRIGGQYSKPRSNDTEMLLCGTEVQVYRGHMVNRPTRDARHHDAWHMLHCFGSAQQISARLGWLRTPQNVGPRPVWTSHEALVLDYERALLRPGRHGMYLSSTHWPWIGDRTRDVHHAHVALAASIENPVSVKIGPAATTRDIAELVGRLNPEAIPGKLTFIARLGANRVAEQLPDLIAAVDRPAGAANWMCDPMHANTRKLPTGDKVRMVDEIASEVRKFIVSCTKARIVPAGIHLEATAEDVLECLQGEEDNSPLRSTTLCDPRLNHDQAQQIVALWGRELERCSE